VFTGIVETVGKVTRLDRGGEGARLEVDAADVSNGVKRGDSVCISGACLTAAKIAGPRLTFDVSRETLERTTLGAFRAGRPVNIERALCVGDRVGGHFVQGHVDGVGRVLAFDRKPGASFLRVGCDPNLALLLIEKGSVALDGVSLTLAELGEDSFSVALVPETLASTTLSSLSGSDAVNLEADMLGKAIVGYLERVRGVGSRSGSGGITLEGLSGAGFL